MHAFGTGFESGLSWRLSVTPMSICHPEHLEGGKIICPPQVLSAITKSEVMYPILFKISSNTKTLYCGPIDWTAEPGRVYVPDWMMANLGVENNSKVTIAVTELPTGTFVKFKPQSANFLTKISDPRAVLEHKLRNYAALKVGEVIYFQYVKNDYFLEVLECKPASHGAISIIEANLEVDFAPPDGYVEPTYTKTTTGGTASPSPFAMDEDHHPSSSSSSSALLFNNNHHHHDDDAEIDDLGIGSDSEDELDASLRAKSPPKAFSGQGHRPSGKAVAASLLEPSLPDLASSPSGRTFITSSGSLVIGPPPSSSSSSASHSSLPPSQKPSINARGVLSNTPAPSSSPSQKPSSPAPQVNNPVPQVAPGAPEPSGFVAFSGAGHKLK